MPSPYSQTNPDTRCIADGHHTRLIPYRRLLSAPFAHVLDAARDIEGFSALVSASPALTALFVGPMLASFGTEPTRMFHHEHRWGGWGQVTEAEAGAAAVRPRYTPQGYKVPPAFRTLAVAASLCMCDSHPP